MDSDCVYTLTPLCETSAGRKLTVRFTPGAQRMNKGGVVLP